VSKTEILTGGFAPTNVTSFEIPNTHFLNKNNLPWGLELEATKFAIPVEKVLFLKAYPLFKDWAESGGVKNRNWFEKPDVEYTHN
jgi:LruC domain-containing protein